MSIHKLSATALVTALAMGDWYGRIAGRGPVVLELHRAAPLLPARRPGALALMTTPAAGP